MVCIVGELYQKKFVVAFLEKDTQQWTGHDQTFVVSKYLPYFVHLTLDQCTFDEGAYHYHFTSETGEVRKGYIRDNQKDAYIVSCNNSYILTNDDPTEACVIWHKLEPRPADICFHLGDQIYADRVYFRWFTQLYKLDPKYWRQYEGDIKKEYYREYYETWYPLRKFLSRTSNIMIPDDHEVKDQATLWSVYLDSQGEASFENIKTMMSEITKGDQLEKKKKLEQFLFIVAHEVCQVLYLGLRLTNTDHFDYFRNFDHCSIIMTERITEPFLGPEYRSKFAKMKHQKNMLWMGGLPPVMILPSTIENIAYGEGNDEKEEDFNQLYHDLFQCNSENIICVGGDLHAGIEGRIYQRDEGRDNHKQGIKFHVASPSSGFPSSHLGEDCVGDTEDYEIVIEEFKNSWANAVYANWGNGSLKTRHIYNKHGNALTMLQNGMVTAGSFWS